MANVIVRLDKIGATAHVESIRVNKDTQNGSILALGALESDGEIIAGSAPLDVSKDELVLLACDILEYKEPSFEQDFILKAGKPGRGYHLVDGDIITLTDNAFETATTVGKYILPVNNKTTLGVADAATTERLVFKAIEKGLLAGEPATTLRVVKSV